MSETRRAPGAPSGKGSVRRAREMMEAGLTPDQVFGQYEDPNLPRATKGSKPSDSSRRPNIPTAFKAPSSGLKGAVISGPSPMAQWPLQDDGDGPGREQARAPRGPPPQRPPRPGNVPSLLDASKVRDYTPTIPYHQYQQDPSYPFPVNSNQTSMSDGYSFPSPANDSNWMDSGRPMNTLPDFPRPTDQPQPPQIAVTGPPGRRNPYSGPPPAGRRGPSSYYSSASMVPPIPEEVPEPSSRYGGSFASSKAIPSSWGSGPPVSDILRDYEEPMDDGHEEHHRFSLQDEETTLVRQASLGKRGKPSLRTISKNGGEQAETRSVGESLHKVDSPESGVLGTVPPAIPANLQNSGHLPSNTRGRRDSDSSESTLDDLEKPPIPMGNNEASSEGPTLKDIENGNLQNVSRQKPRPPRLNIDAVREAESRGSLTSLPDLIRRATKLRTNLDRGKTASRLGMLDLLNGSGEFKKGTRNSGSISDILGSFPRPGAATPTGIPNRANPEVNFPDTGVQSPAAKRRCCGIRRPLFIFLCILIVVLIVAAVLVPVFLIVVPRQREDSQTKPSQAAAQDSCQSTHPCMNGGVSVGTAESCSCVCFGGYSGSKCDVAGDNSCVTTSIMNGSSNFQNVTLGSALPRLFKDSETNFSIPLNASKIVALLNADDTSCTSANALVTFNGASRKRSGSIISEIHEVLDQGIKPRHRRSHLHDLVERSAQKAAANQDNIASPTRIITGATFPTATASAKPTEPTPTSIPTQALDFSRVAVLYLLEQSGSTDTAIDVHDSIQSFLKDSKAFSKGIMDHTSKTGSSKVDFKLDFDNFTISLDDGVTVGAP